jgi:outer membrane protein assembly factor BamB
MEQFGYLCSSYCKGQAQARKLKVPVYEGQIFEKQKAEGRSHGMLIMASVGVIALLFSVYVWYWFFGSRPKQAFRIETPPSAPFLHADWIGQDRFFAVTTARAALFNAKDGSEIWTYDLPKNEIKTYSSKGEERGQTDWSLDFEPVVKLVSKDIWIGLPSRVLRLDGQTGKKKQEIMLAQRASDYSASETHLLAVSRNETNDAKLLTRVSLADGRADAQYTPASSGAQRLIATVRPMQGLGNTSLKNFSEDDEEFSEFNEISYGRDPDFVFTGPNVAHMTRQLVESRIAVQATARKKAGPLLIDSSNVRASQGIEAAEEFFNQNAPDEKIDQSLYKVTIDRYFGNAPQWTGQIAGRPSFHAQKTVDLLVGGTTLIVFNKNNQKQWEAKLTYTIAAAAAFSDEGPALEAGNRLLFYDQGVLTAFDLKKGEALWRVNSVGISGLTLDSSGNVYLNSTTAGPETIRYSGQVNFSEKVRPMIVKVELRSGKVLWQAVGVGEECMVSGDYVYAADSQISGLDVMRTAMGGGSAPVHWRLHRINPSSGKEKWEYYREGAPVDVRPKEKQILLQFKNDLRLLKYL